MIPESYDVVSGFLEHLRPCGVLVNPLGMLPTVNFDDELQIQRDKIDDIARDRFLPLELDAIGSAIAQLAPHYLLCFGHPASQSTRLLVHSRAPSPHPLPNGERALAPPFAVANPCPIHD